MIGLVLAAIAALAAYVVGWRRGYRAGDTPRRRLGE